MQQIINKPLRKKWLNLKKPNQSSNNMCVSKMEKPKCLPLFKRME